MYNDIILIHSPPCPRRGRQIGSFLSRRTAPRRPAGQALASAKKWSGLGRSERALWGLCQGSGKSPYQARVDLSEPAFKCSCPSRKFPCKHGLGLLLLFAKDEKSFKTGAEPGWVADWLAGRSDRAEKKVEKAKEAAAKPVDVEAQAKRAAQRESRVQEGVAECRVWLDDLIRRGLAAVQSESESFWDRAAGRMVDAQAPGLATLISRTRDMIASGEGWHTRTLDHLGRLHLLLSAAQKLAELPPDLAGDVRTALGWTQSKEECLAGEGGRGSLGGDRPSHDGRGPPAREAHVAGGASEREAGAHSGFRRRPAADGRVDRRGDGVRRGGGVLSVAAASAGAGEGARGRRTVAARARRRRGCLRRARAASVRGGPERERRGWRAGR